MWCRCSLGDARVAGVAWVMVVCAAVSACGRSQGEGPQRAVVGGAGTASDAVSAQGPSVARAGAAPSLTRGEAAGGEVPGGQAAGGQAAGGGVVAGPSQPMPSRAAEKPAEQAGSMQGATDPHGSVSALQAEVERRLSALRERYTGQGEVARQIDEAQTAWSRFAEAEALERFPHQNEPGYYGSVLGMCLAIDREQLLRHRAAQLESPLCEEPASTAPSASPAPAQADAELNQVYARVRSKHAQSPVFLEALRNSQRVWLTFRDAQVGLARSVGGPSSRCADQELERVTRQRVDMLRAWLQSPEEGEVCAGG